MNAQATAIGISTRSNMYRALLVLLGLFTLFGISFYILEIRSGASPTSWGMLTTNFLFLPADPQQYERSFTDGSWPERPTACGSSL